MLTKEDQKIIGNLRKNARVSLVAISETTNIPQSTLYDKLKTFEQTIIKKHTCLLDYKKLGYAIEVKIAVKIKRDIKEVKEKLALYFKEHPNVNSAYYINSGYDFFIECIFENYSEMFAFINKMEEQFPIEKQEMYHILHEIKHEEFLMSI